MKSQPSLQRDQMDPSQIGKDLWSQTLTGPQFVYSSAGAASAAVLAATAGSISPLFNVLVGAAVLMSSFAAGWVAFSQTVLRDRRMHARMVALQERMAKEIEVRQAEMASALQSQGERKGARQFEALTTQFDLLSKTLSERFNPGEMTHVRYLGTAEQVYLGALDNLQVVLDAARQIRSTDLAGIERHLAEATAAGQDRLAASLRERRDLVERLKERVSMAYAANEEALLSIEQVHEALIGLNTGQGLASEPLDNAMAELQRLAQRTAEFGQ